VSDREGDASQRLSDALDAVFRRRAADGEREFPEDALAEESVAHEAAPPEEDPARADSEHDPDRFDIPEIVPATLDLPTLPDQPPRRVTPVQVDSAPLEPQIVSGTTDVIPSALAVAPPANAPAAVAPPVTSWGDHVAVNPTAAASGQLRDPGRRPRVRKVTRVVRHIDPWSTFKLALVFSMVGYLVVLTSGVLLWRVADSTGTLDNIERWFTQFGWETFELKGGEIFHNAWVIGLFLAVGLTGAAVLVVTLFNLVSDIVGGIRVTVLEEEVVERTASSARRYVVRRPPMAGADRAPSWSVDDPDPEPAPPKAPTAAPAPAPVVTADWSVDD
jgi:hypothetical protein